MPTQVGFGFVLEYVHDIEAMRRYCVDVLGLTVEREHPTFVQFTDPGGTRFAIASDAPLSGTRDREVYWVVDDAAAAYDELSPLAEVNLPVTELPFGKVFGLSDPAGKVHYLVEFAQDRPSQKLP